MLRGVAVVWLSLVTVALSQQHTIQLPSEWHSWKAEHGKSYNGFHEELQRHVMWKANQQYIDAHNAYEQIFGFALGMNQFGDLSDVEYNRQYSCVAAPYRTPHNTSLHSKYSQTYHPPVNLSLPEMVDWRSMGAVSSVKSQGDCCSCYAFSAVEALEGVHALASDHLVELSAQNVLDCSGLYGNHGCIKGSTSIAFTYIVDSNGVDTDRSYPYEGEEGKCRFKERSIGAKMRNYIKIARGYEEDLQAAVAYQGPVSAAVDASHNIFRFYSRGILNVPNCSRRKLSQALVVIGYGTYYNRDYWLVKNSWGESWGMRGFGMLSRNKYNQCGIATRAMFPAI